MGVGRGFAKLLLFGEHVAVYGYPAAGVSLPFFTEVLATPVDTPKGNVTLESGTRADAEIVAALAKSVAVSAGVGSRETGFALEVRSEVPRGTGLGSSAALCVAMARAIAPAETTETRLWEIANEAEQVFHGTPSGIDTGLALLGGLRGFRPAPPALPGVRALAGFPFHLVVGSLPRIGTTRALVKSLRERLKTPGDRAIREIEGLGAIAAAAIDLLSVDATGTAHDLAKCATQAQDRLRALDLSTAATDETLEAAIRGGALGGKLSGAGGGGAFFLLYPGAEEAVSGAELMRRLGGSQGLRVIGAFEWRDDRITRLST